MNCREFEADVVDLARGAEMSAASAARLAAHLEQCAGCAARFARERQLTTALKAMTEAEPPSARAAAIEAQLLLAFAERQAAVSRQQTPSRSVFAMPAARMGLAAAAVLVVAVAVWQGAARRPSSDEAPPEPTLAPANQAAPPLATAGSVASSDGRNPSLSAGAPARGELRPSRVSRKPGPRPVPAGDNGVLRFVTLPTAIGLPALESGRIVRVELPTAMLPAYGLDVTPDPAASAVEADVLVGQDGQPRAIRFVTVDSDPRRRQ